MSSMVVKTTGNCIQVTSLSVQEKGSRNKRKFHSDPPLSDPCEVVSLPNDCPDYDFSADEFSTEKFKLRPVHGQGTGCDFCGVNGDHSDALKLDLGLSNAMSSSDAGFSQPKAEGIDVFHDADWSDLTETQLEELVLSNLDAIIKSAIKKIVSNGYTEDVAVRAVLRSGLCYGSKDIVSNIVDNTLAYLKNGQEADPTREHCFEDLQQLEKYILVELICILQAVRPLFSTGDAMWCLLLCDMNVSHACAMDGDPLSNFSNDGVSNASSFTAPQPELKPEAKIKDSSPSSPSKPTAKGASMQSSQLGKDASAGPQNSNKQKTVHSLKQTTSGKESSTGVSVSVDKPFKATVMQQTTTSEDKPVPSRKLHSNSAKRESVLRQKSSHVEKNHRTYDTKGVSRAAKLSGLGGLILDRKLRESAGINLKNASIRMKALGVEMSITRESMSMSQANSTISLSTKSIMLNSKASPPLNLGTATSMSASSKTEKLPSQSVLPAADTELSLSLPAKNNTPPVVPSDKSLGQGVAQDKKDEMIMKLYPKLRELQNQMQEWTKWANQKVMQAARRLGKDKAELKMLRQEKEEVERLKKEKQTLEDNTMKKLSEMENALSKASGQVDRANSAVRRLEVENTTLRQEMEAEKLRATESAAGCQEARKREKKTLIKYQSWEKQKVMFQEDLAAERRKLTQLQNEVGQEKDHLLQIEARWKQEEKAKNEILGQAHSIRREREQLESSTKSKEETVKSRAETNLERYKDDIQKLEKEISQLRLKTDSSKIAALKMGINGNYPNKVTPTKSFESQSPYAAGMHGYQDESGIGGVKRDRECVMCLSEEMSVVFLPCAHQVVCEMCNELHEKQGMKECPSCRSIIQRRICVRYARS